MQPPQRVWPIEQNNIEATWFGGAKEFEGTAATPVAGWNGGGRVGVDG
eukprot:CAMPEP_0119315922 /NCGR_PEP_ID=MMETSP1333-20130426/37763_1 /TAXON_ID=418940 /ORGANISM="Scyphosphaera apsteinii, Strain RCC1455" /LENGTH=47 /DNA_ID= /DNA_START= /DNA_END= /DNA_ORIENTATION=